MKVREFVKNGCRGVAVSGVKNFDINKIFDCGQCFRFERVENSLHEKEFSGVAYDRFVSFASDGDELFIYGSDLADFEAIWRSFLDLDRDYGEVTKSILTACDNPTLALASQYGDGIRILSQQPFEALISFIISQNNNIPRIKKIIESLSRECGEPIDIPDALRAHASAASSLCTFPTAEKILALGVEGLRRLRVGFRAAYIYDAALRVSDGRLSLEAIMKDSDIESVICALCTVHGVGVKVASCTALFGLCKYNAFPVDVWMKRVALKYFPEQGEALAWQTFGEYAGIAQQYLFYYERYNASRN